MDAGRQATAVRWEGQDLHPAKRDELRRRETGPLTAHTERGGARIRAPMGPGKCIKLNREQVTQIQCPYILPPEYITSLNFTCHPKPRTFESH